MKTENPERNRPHSTRRLAAVTVAWLAAGGLLTGVIVLTTRLRPAERATAASPCPDGPDGASFDTCYLCLGCTPMRLPPNGIHLRGDYPGQHGTRPVVQIRLCDACGVGLDSWAEQRALRNWIDAEVLRLREAVREAEAAPDALDEMCARLRQARLVNSGPDLEQP